jgi:hypothetical protein
MIDIRVDIDQFGKGMDVREIGRVCVANLGDTGFGDTKYKVWLFVQGNTNRAPKEFNRSADLTLFITHFRPDGVWALIRKVFDSEEYIEFCKRDIKERSNSNAKKMANG